MKNVKWSFVLLLIVMAVVSGVSLSCSNDEYDEPMGLKTMARRKANSGGDSNEFVVENNSHLLPQLNLLAGVNCYAQLSISWGRQVLNSNFKVELNEENPIVAHLSGLLVKRWMIGSKEYEDFYIRGWRPTPRVWVENVDEDQKKVTVGYEIKYKLLIEEMKKNGTNNDTDSCSTSSEPVETDELLVSDFCDLHF